MLRTSLLLGVLTLIGASTAHADGGWVDPGYQQQQQAAGHWEQRGYEWFWVADVQQPCAEDQQAYGYDTGYSQNYGSNNTGYDSTGYGNNYVSYAPYVAPQVHVYRPAPVIRIQSRWGWNRAPRFEQHRRWDNHRGHDRGRRGR